MGIQDLASQLAEIHRTEYGRAPAVMAYAPGRVEVLGNHTDYNEGTVLAAAINMGTCFALSPNDGRGIRLYAHNLNGRSTLTLGTTAAKAEAHWARYVQGVLHYLRERGLAIENWDCSFFGTLPIGSGLSSSASLEVASAYAACRMLKASIPPIEIAKICQAAEINFAGCHSGLLDQCSSIFGAESQLIHIDFRSLAVKQIALPLDVRFLLITPNVPHILSESPYNSRRRSCEVAAKLLTAELIKERADYEGKTLRDIDVPTFYRLRHLLVDEVACHAEHIVTEIHRVEQGVKAVLAGNAYHFGKLMTESHESSRHKFKNSTPELDTVVAAAVKAGALGARLSGGGWGGSLIAMVWKHEAAAIQDRIAELCKEAEFVLEYRVLIPSAGAEILDDVT